MFLFDACKSSGLRTSGFVCQRDAYYVGVQLDIIKGDSQVYVFDKAGNRLDYVYLDLSLEGHTKSHNVPVPVFAPGGIYVEVIGLLARCIVYYAEQYFAKGHVRA